MGECESCQKPLDGNAPPFCAVCVERILEQACGPYLHPLRQEIERIIAPDASAEPLINALQAFTDAGRRIQEIEKQVVPGKLSREYIDLAASEMRALKQGAQRYRELIAGSDPALEFHVLLWTYAIPLRRQIRRYMWSQFHFDIRRRIRRGSKSLPYTPETRLRIMTAMRTYKVFNRMFIAMLGAVLVAPDPGTDLEKALQDFVVKAGDAMRKEMFDILPELISAEMKHLPWAQEGANLTLAGWACTELKQFPRLRLALKEELTSQGTEREKSTSEELKDHLPAAVWEAFCTQERADLKDIVHKIDASVIKECPPRPEGEVFLDDLVHRARQPLADDPLRNPATQIEAEDLAANAEIFRRAGLTQNEEASFRLNLEEYPDKQIAAVLNKSLNAVKQDLLRAREKLKRLFPK